jgi:hypothetical protein
VENAKSKQTQAATVRAGSDGLDMTSLQYFQGVGREQVELTVDILIPFGDLPAMQIQGTTRADQWPGERIGR